MKHETVLIAWLSGAAFTIGCDQADTTTSQRLENVEDRNDATDLDIENYTYNQKDQFVQTMEIRLAEINQELNEMSAKLERSSAEARAEAQPKMRALRDQSDALSRQLDEVKDASESNWENVKIRSQETFESLEEGFQESRQWLSEKIAP